MMVVVSGRSPARVGDKLALSIRPELVHLFDAATELAI